MNEEKYTGLIFAMQEEQTGFDHYLSQKQIHKIAQRQFIQAKFGSHKVICVLAGIGKVAASMTASIMLDRFPMKQVIMCGVAGGIHQHLHQGDVVIASELIQHDMDASPLFPKFEIPLTGKACVQSDQRMTEQLTHASKQFLASQASTQKAQVKVGLIASGDQFISDHNRLNQLRNDLPELLAVEMEGAAIAQVCEAFEVPFSVIRTISDSANDEATQDFQSFIKTTAAPYSIGILKAYFSA
ncbi:5'-methylthioadenosine/adenosylhomocysteine nucleosidase [Undibacterium cyanobacteriorum]|uniref:adenosylhomocysteine nucleosidase n=1 Tax=Undibacterium cyanobacteriorum TaxID=3073561 RepID=A0ABY9RHG4_9BURK|nr:5'-methylthioadenosine/adenosylhomocysteine nucleosidase [Undibacterium sp. 20NA77.5]WMW80677.1 5'-methylthioadenosine/adenosylhomocysteine nucleosidase [Undibacterium sp. 20NA77.5]